MEEILPGIQHWTAVHPKIKTEVSSYYVEPIRVLLDPMVPEEGLGWFEERGEAPRQVILTNRHHLRDSERFAEAFGCPIRASEPGLHEFAGGPEVEGFDFGDELAPGIVAIEVDSICPDETALLVEHGGAVAIADGAMRYGGEIRFVPDNYMDDPERTKEGLKEAFRSILEERDFDNLLFAHGDPLIGGGNEALRRFATS
jgi:hypothetical protein